MRKLVLAGLLVATAACGGGPRPETAPVRQAGTPLKEMSSLELAHRVMDASQAGPILLRGMKEVLVPAMRARKPDMPQAFWTEVLSRSKDEMPSLMDRLGTVCAAKFSRAELVELAAFYDSPVGRRWPIAIYEIREEAARGADGGTKLPPPAASRDTGTFRLAVRVALTSRPEPAPAADAKSAEAKARTVRRLHVDFRVARLLADRFSRDELTQLAEFHASSVGKRWVAEHPIATREGEREMKLWSMRIAADAMKDLAERGIMPIP